MDDHGAPLVAWARIALKQYAIDAHNVQFLGHSENITFQVADNERGEKFLLRLHRPISANYEGLRQQPAAIESELRWLEALARDTTVTVQQPVRNTQGRLVTIITFPDGSILPCTLLRWVEGEPFAADASDALDRARQLGYLVARLHHHASAWLTPDAFVRPSYGADFFSQVVVLLQPGVAMGIIEQQDYAIIQQTMDTIIALMAGVEQSREQWGLIHNDLHPGNYLVFGAEIRPIDFSLCGFGYFLFDLSTAVGSLPVPLRRPLIDSYSRYRPLAENYVRLVEACFIVSRMSSYAFTLPNTRDHEWLKGRIPQVVETICRRFLHDESFLFTIR